MQQAYRRVLLGRLEDKGITAGDRIGEHPHRDHRREVERRDTSDNTQRLPNLIDIDAAARLLAESAFEKVRDTAGELDILETSRDFTERIGQRLAMLH